MKLSEMTSNQSTSGSLARTGAPALKRPAAMAAMSAPLVLIFILRCLRCGFWGSVTGTMRRHELIRESRVGGLRRRALFFEQAQEARPDEAVERDGARA